MKINRDATPTQQAALREQAMEQLAIIGGKLDGEDAVQFKGTKFILPSHQDLRGSIEFLEELEASEEEPNNFRRQFNYRPYDGARATAQAIREAFGWAQGKTLYSFFGAQRPEMIEIDVAFGVKEQVPWGALTIPGLNDTTLYLGHAHHDKFGLVFQITAQAPKKYRHHIEGLFALIQQNLETNSIYRGKSVTADAEFIDTSGVHRELLVYTESVEQRLEGDLWAFIKYERALAEQGQSGKYAVLLEGPFGSGKTEAAGVTAQIANEHGWTFITARAGEMEVQKALQLAQLYQPAVVFAEDIETEVAPDSPSQISRVLDMIDGFHVKGQKLVVVFTTNHADRIHKGMLRPGRIGAVIHIGEMDRPGVEKLTRRVIGKNLAEDVNFDKVYEAMEGYMPAFVKEALNRAVRYAISRNGGKVAKIDTTALCLAADGLRDQLRLMEDAPTDAITNHLSVGLGSIVRQELLGLKLVDNDDDDMATFAKAD